MAETLGVRGGGRLGVLTQGMGAVATTFFAGAILVARGEAPPVGSLTQLGYLPSDGEPRIRDALPLARPEDLVFGGWDALPDDAYRAAVTAGVLGEGHLRRVRDDLRAIEPLPAVFEDRYVARLKGTHRKGYGSLREAAEAVREDIRNFRREHDLGRVVVVSCSSTEAYVSPQAVHTDLGAFEAGLDLSDPGISPSMVYAYAAIMEGVPYANGTPSWAVDAPALAALARERGVPVAGKDFKTGQTLLKTVLAPGLAARMLGLRGWYSTNILGNRDGEVLDDEGSFRSKEATKLGVLGSILDAGRHPELYGDVAHRVRIDYYPPRGDSKEGWDNIDIFGWLGYPMQIKVNFLARDSVLAAPIVLDLALLLDLAQRAGRAGAQEWLSFFFKSPQTAGGPAEHDLFVQLGTLMEALREMSRSGGA